MKSNWSASHGKRQNLRTPSKKLKELKFTRRCGLRAALRGDVEADDDSVCGK